MTQLYRFVLEAAAEETRSQEGLSACLLPSFRLY